MREAASFIARQSGSAEAGILYSLENAIHQVFRRWSNRRKIVTLNEFDDRMLADIGLTRDDIREALRLPFAADPTQELVRLAGRNRARGWNA